MKRLVYTLRGDGPTDKMLMPILRWLMECHFPSVELLGQYFYSVEYPLKRRPDKSLKASLKAAVEHYPCDLLFVHRDSEGQEPAQREDEIQLAISGIANFPAFPIPVIPVRMSETWLLIDEKAIREAVANPNGKQSCVCQNESIWNGSPIQKRNFLNC